MAKGQANAGYRFRNHGKMSPDAPLGSKAREIDEAAREAAAVAGERQTETVKPGDLIKALSWTIMTPSRLRLGMRADEGTVAMFMYLGSKPLKDDTELKQVDIFKYLYSMGFVPMDPEARKHFLKMVNDRG